MGDEGVFERVGHEGGVAGLSEEVVEELCEVFGLGGEHDEALTEARGEREQVRGAQLVEQAVVAREDDAQDGARVEVGGGEQAHLGEHGVLELLRLVDEQERSHAGVVEVGAPALAQHLEAVPAIVVHQRDAEQLAHLAVEVGKARGGMGERGDAQPLGAFGAFGEQAQRHALSGAGRAGDEGEAAGAHQMVLDAAAEAVHRGGGHEALDGQLGGEGIELQPVEGQ